MLEFAFAMLLMSANMFGCAFLVAWLGWVPVIGITPYRRMPKEWRDENPQE